MRGHAQCIATSDDAMLTWTKRPDPVIGSAARGARPPCPARSAHPLDGARPQR